MAKNRNLLIGIVIVVVLVIIGIIMFSGPPRESAEGEGTVGLIETFGLEEIVFTGQERIETVDNPGEDIYLIIDGSFNRITVTKETVLSVLEIRGNNNRVNLCDNIFDLSIRQQGGSNNIFYSQC